MTFGAWIRHIPPRLFLMAMGQVFFSLSICAGGAMTYASYLSKNANIPRTSSTIAAMDTLAAFFGRFGYNTIGFRFWT